MAGGVEAISNEKRRNRQLAPCRAAARLIDARALRRRTLLLPLLYLRASGNRAALAAIERNRHQSMTTLRRYRARAA